MNRTNLILLLVAIALVCVFVTTFYFTHVALLEVREVPVDVEIVDYNVHGINAEPTALNFSTVPRNAISYRWITLDNNHPFPISVLVDIPEDLEGIIFVDIDKFRLAPNQTVKLTFSAYGNPEKTAQHYVGYVKISISKG